MAIYKIRCFNLGSIADGSYAEKEFSPPEDWHIHKIHILDRGGSSLYNTQVYIKIGEDVITDDFAPARLFHPESRNHVVIDKDVSKGTSIYVKVSNNEGSAINVDVCFELTE